MNDDPADKKAGTIKHDASGRAVWEWSQDTGKFGTGSTSRLLKRLEVPGLKLEEDTPKTPAAPEERKVFGGPVEKDPKAGSRASFNPYDTGPKSRSSLAAQTRPAASKPISKPPASPPVKRGLFSRLFGKK
jgi:hypothetical protein